VFDFIVLYIKILCYPVLIFVSHSFQENVNIFPYIRPYSAYVSVIYPCARDVQSILQTGPL